MVLAAEPEHRRSSRAMRLRRVFVRASALACAGAVSALAMAASGGCSARSLDDDGLSGKLAADDGGDAAGDGGAPPGIVISQVFAAGGHDGAPFKRDFVEFFNRSSRPQILSGMSLQYATSDGAFPMTTDGGPSGRLVFPKRSDGSPLEIPAGGYLLLLLGGEPGGDGADLRGDLMLPLGPTTLNLDAARGKIALVATGEPLGCGAAGERCDDARLVDLVGYGPRADGAGEGVGSEGVGGDAEQGVGAVSDYEGAGPAVLEGPLALLRVANGCQDENDNQADFVAGAPAPRSTRDPRDYCGLPPPVVDAGADAISDAAASEPEPEPTYARSLVIREVYGAGGEPGAVFKRDYVEVFNASAKPQVLTGLSLQYATGSGAFRSTLDDEATIHSVVVFPKGADGADLVVPAGGSFLVAIGGKEDGAGDDIEANMVVRPGPTALDLDPTEGKIALVRSSEPLLCGAADGARCATTRIVDLVGYGAGASDYEGSGSAPSPSVTKALQRAEGGCKDTDDNRSDLAAATPKPRNSRAKASACGAPPRGALEPEELVLDEAPSDTPRTKGNELSEGTSDASASGCATAPGASTNGDVFASIGALFALAWAVRRRAADRRLDP